MPSGDSEYSLQKVPSAGKDPRPGSHQRTQREERISHSPCTRWGPLEPAWCAGRVRAQRRGAAPPFTIAIKTNLISWNVKQLENDVHLKSQLPVQGCHSTRENSAHVKSRGAHTIRLFFPSPRDTTAKPAIPTPLRALNTIISKATFKIQERNDKESRQCRHHAGEEAKARAKPREPPARPEMNSALKPGVNLNASNTRKMPPTRASNLYSTFPLNPTRLPVTADTARQKSSFTAHGQHRGSKDQVQWSSPSRFSPSEQQILNSKMTRRSG